MENLESKIKEYKEYSRMIEELETLKTAIADNIKEYMTQEGQSKITIGEYKISYVDCTRKDLDKKALQVKYEEIYNAHLRETTYKRFSIA